ncbi:MAG TPA: SET domain-containing protein [Cyclobacteriaceae bacterium]|nr:SET domain-containing protein [Cyclobacteriaceae bacterium]
MINTDARLRRVKQQPLKRIKKVLIKKSLLPGAGKGLFAKTAFKKGDRITEYAGPLKKWKDVKDQDGYNAYLLRLNRTTAIDARRSKSPGRYANDAAGFVRVPGLRNNAEYLTYGNRCFIEATRKIKKGEEIFVSYGGEFWRLQKKIGMHP